MYRSADHSLKQRRNKRMGLRNQVSDILFKLASRVSPGKKGRK